MRDQRLCGFGQPHDTSALARETAHSRTLNPFTFRGQMGGTMTTLPRSGMAALGKYCFY